jgi:hypothetical protein
MAIEPMVRWLATMGTEMAPPVPPADAAALRASPRSALPSSLMSRTARAANPSATSSSAMCGKGERRVLDPQRAAGVRPRGRPRAARRRRPTPRSPFANPGSGPPACSRIAKRAKETPKGRAGCPVEIGEFIGRFADFSGGVRRAPDFFVATTPIADTGVVTLQGAVRQPATRGPSRSPSLDKCVFVPRNANGLVARRAKRWK